MPPIKTTCILHRAHSAIAFISAVAFVAMAVCFVRAQFARDDFTVLRWNPANRNFTDFCISHRADGIYIHAESTAASALDDLHFGDERDHGVKVLRKACESPLRQIAANAGEEGSVIVETVRAGQGGFGYNAGTGTMMDLMAAGVLDPTKVVRVALMNAASVATMLLTTECAIVEATKDVN